MAMGEADVKAMAQRIGSTVARDGWKSDQSVVPDMQKILGKLTTLKVDVDLLQRTGIGKMVSKLKKHQDEIVSGYSSTLTNKWQSQLGIASKNNTPASTPRRSASAPASDAQRQPAPQSSSAVTTNADRLENARKRLQQGYASEKSKRDSRSLQVLTRPIDKRARKGLTVSTAPSRSSVAMRQLQQRRPLSASSASRTVAPPARSSLANSAPARRVMPASATQPMRRVAPAGHPVSLDNMTPEERHHMRQQRLRAAAGVNRQREEASNGGRPAASSRANSSSQRSVAPSREQDVDPRKAMLNKMYPRVCGVSSTAGTPKAGGTKKSPTAQGGKRGKAPPSYTEAQREVIGWLKGLDADMSEYAPAFFENGFDSIKLLRTVQESDLPGLIPKKGHHRVIQQALTDLKRKQTTAASRTVSKPHKKTSRYHDDPYADLDSDDSFVVDDDDGYRPGSVSAMIMNKRYRKRPRLPSFDSEGSSDMEATFDEIQHEEERSKRYGEFEDYQEELRNKKMLKKKSK